MNGYLARLPDRRQPMSFDLARSYHKDNVSMRRAIIDEVKANYIQQGRRQMRSGCLKIARRHSRKAQAGFGDLERPYLEGKAAALIELIRDLKRLKP